MSFSKPNVRQLITEAVEVLNAHFSERGITFERGNASFTSEKCSFKVDAIAPGADPDRTEFDLHCRRFGLSPEDFGREFVFNGTRFTLVGLRPRAPKYPLVGERSDGARYSLPRVAVNSLRAA
jgi:hypothetical protein